MTGIRFLDELAAPRRSMMHQLQSTQLQASQKAGKTLADYVVAMAVDAPQLELYSHVADDLRRWIEHSKEIYHQAEEEAEKVTPMLFREYTMADEQTQVELLVCPLSFCVCHEDQRARSNNSNLSKPTTTLPQGLSGTIGGCSG